MGNPERRKKGEGKGKKKDSKSRKGGPRPARQKQTMLSRQSSCGPFLSCSAFTNAGMCSVSTAGITSMGGTGMSFEFSQLSSARQGKPDDAGTSLICL